MAPCVFFLRKCIKNSKKSIKRDQCKILIIWLVSLLSLEPIFVSGLRARATFDLPQPFLALGLSLIETSLKHLDIIDCERGEGSFLIYDHYLQQQQLPNFPHSRSRTHFHFYPFIIIGQKVWQNIAKWHSWWPEFKWVHLYLMDRGLEHELPKNIPQANRGKNRWQDSANRIFSINSKILSTGWECPRENLFHEGEDGAWICSWLQFYIQHRSNLMWNKLAT